AAPGTGCGCGSAPATTEAKAEQKQSSPWPAGPSQPVEAVVASCCGPSRPAETAASGCCGSSASPMWLPDAAEEPATPVQVPDYQVDTEADLALGCGNAVGLAAPRPGETVLDIGSGAGADVFPVARLVGAAGRVIGVDRLPEMLDRARATAARLELPNVE